MKFVALLRGINVGGHVVKMDRLRALFKELGFSAVQTFIASGNVIFSANARSVPALERKIERHLEAALGYEVPTFLRTADELSAVAAYQPFPSAQGGGAVPWLSAVPSRPRRGAQGPGPRQRDRGDPRPRPRAVLPRHGPRERVGDVPRADRQDARPADHDPQREHRPEARCENARHVCKLEARVHLDHDIDLTSSAQLLRGDTHGPP